MSDSLRAITDRGEEFAYSLTAHPTVAVSAGARGSRCQVNGQKKAGDSRLERFWFSEASRT